MVLANMLRITSVYIGAILKALREAGGLATPLVAALASWIAYPAPAIAFIDGINIESAHLFFSRTHLLVDSSRLRSTIILYTNRQ